jgi:hypothetical protein
MERGCVADRPQRLEESESPENFKALPLAADDPAALRDFQTGLKPHSAKCRFS